MPDKGTEDIVGRLEALRKRVPAEAPPEKKATPEADERRKKIARAIGILIVVLFIFGIAYAGYKFIYIPKKAQERAMIDQATMQQVALQKAKQETVAALRSDFAGLPQDYRQEEESLIRSVEGASTTSEVQGLKAKGQSIAKEGWIAYRTIQLGDLAKKTDKLRMIVTVQQKVGNETKQISTYYKGEERIRGVLHTLSIPELKSATIEEIRTTYVAVRLERLQAGGGLVEIGKKVNIYFREVGDDTQGATMTALAKDAKVMAVMRAQSSSISLTESENKKDTGVGGSTTGTATVSLGGIGPISTEGGVSAGYRERQTQTTYSIDLIEVQKAAAASKLEESYIESVLMKYGIKLGNIERESNIADFEEEYILLLEVSEE